MNCHRIVASAFAVGPFLIAGCTLGPTYSRPTVATPAAWKETTALSAAPVETPLPAAWWTIFNDAELNRLETQVVAANHDLQRAAARVDEARALARISAADLYPDVSVDATNSRFRTSANRANSIGQKITASDHVAQVELGYELDFWGRVRRSSEAAQADAGAIADDYHTAVLLLTAETAQTYWQLRSLDAERAVLEATLALRRDAVRLQETRNRSGLINEVDVTRAQTELANVEAELHAITRQRARAEHALAVLAGQTPTGFTVAARAVPFIWPVIPAGLPSALLQRRPDLASAEHTLEAACARIGVAKADFFPRISLTGAAGFASSDLSSLLEGDSRTWSFGPSVHLPLFEGGRNRANLAAAEARYEQNVATYRSAVLTAFREVEDSLSDLSALAAQHAAVDRSLLSARDTAGLASARYEKGLSNYLDVVDAQRSVLQTERLAVQLQGQRAIVTVQLAKALGGGWEQPNQIAQR